MVSTTIAIIIGAASLIVGGVSGYFLAPDAKTDDTQTQRQLTDPELLRELCKSTDATTCRELACRYYLTIKGGSSQRECESISNVANTITILETCEKTKDKDKCFILFRERK